MPSVCTVLTCICLIRLQLMVLFTWSKAVEAVVDNYQGVDVAATPT